MIVIFSTDRKWIVVSFIRTAGNVWSNPELTFQHVAPQASVALPRHPQLAALEDLLEVAIRYPEADTIHLVLDNRSLHTRRAVVERFGQKAGGWLWVRFTVHYTPKH